MSTAYVCGNWLDKIRNVNSLFIVSMQVVRDMLDPNKGQELRKLINNETHPYNYYGPINYHIDVTDGTTHLSVIDKDGNAVALTTSINK